MVRSTAAMGMLFALSFLASCSSGGSLMPADGGPQVEGNGICNADKVAWAVGQPWNEANWSRVRKESGSGLMRPIGPDQAIPRDYRADRLNVYLDARNIVTRLTCG